MTRPLRREQLRDLGWICLAVLGLHGLLLQSAALSWRGLAAASDERAAAALHVRVVDPAGGPLVEAAPARATRPAPVPPPAPVSQQTPEPIPAPAGSQPAAVGTLDGARVAPLPTYATRLAGSATLRYRLLRGARQGEAVLQWQVESGAYELSLSHRVPGQDSAGWVSRGQIESAGVAPLRLVERRRERDRAALSMDRERGELSFSGPSQRHPLVSGLQDRLSWILQLPAIVEADPSRFTAGRSIVMWVAGLRGELDLWTFVVQGREAGRPPGPGNGEHAGVLASQDTLHLTRESLRPYDPRIDVWLDPERHHLPVRILFTPVPSGEVTDMVWVP